MNCLKKIAKFFLKLLWRDMYDRIYTKYYLGVADLGNTFGYNFKEYFLNENMPERIRALKRNLDEKSISVIDNKLDHFLNLPLYSSKFAWSAQHPSRTILYTEEELAENKKFIEALPDLRKKYLGDFDGMVPEVFYYHHGLKFLHNKELEYLKDKAFIDLGAFWGDSALVLSQYRPSKIYSFEISPQAEEKYTKNLRMNHIETPVEFINKGVSNQKSTFRVSNARHQDSFSHTNSANDSSIVEIDTLDNLIPRDQKVGLIKMDIEGAEYDAVLGAKRIITRDNPILLITIYHTPKQFFELKPLIEQMSGNAYSFMIRNLNFYIHSELETTLIGVPKNL